MNRSYEKFICLASIALLLLSGVCLAEDPSQPVLNSDQTESTAPVLEAKEVGDGRISMDFRDALLPEVLKVLSSLTGANFVTAEDAALKKINIFLENVTFADALTALVKGNGLVATRVGEENIYMIRVGTGEDALIPLETRVIKMKYVRVTKVKVLSITEGASGGTSGTSGSTSGATGSTSVGASASVSGGEPAEIKDTIEDLLSPRGKVTVNDRTNSLIITDTAERVDEIEKVLKILDHPLDQVLIEAIIIERSLTFNKYLGTEWGTGTEGQLGTVAGARGVFNVPSVNQFGDLFRGEDLLNKGTGLSFGSFDFSQMEATLKALQTDQRAKVLAKPRVLVLDNEPAFIKITVNEVIGTNSQVTPGSSSQNITATTAERSETGVTLKVTPLINDDRNITMLLEPRYATADTSSFSSSFRDPRIRASRTTLAVESGRVITISGLMQRDETKIKRKVPILGDIPVFGVFFSKWTTQKVDRELIIFLRPHIVKHGEFGLVRTDSIPDKMTSIDEEAAEFWKIWDKPWFKELKANSSPRVREMASFFNERDQVMDQALTFNALKESTQLADAEKVGEGKPEVQVSETAAAAPSDAPEADQAAPKPA